MYAEGSKLVSCSLSFVHDCLVNYCLFPWNREIFILFTQMMNFVKAILVFPFLSGAFFLDASRPSESNKDGYIHLFMFIIQCLSNYAYDHNEYPILQSAGLCRGLIFQSLKLQYLHRLVISIGLFC